MKIPRVVLFWVPTVVMVLGAGIVCPQGYPNKPIRIVTGPAGGGNDFTARPIAQGISGPLGQPVIVDNRGSGFLPAEIVSKAQSDGYTMVLASSSLWISSLLEKMSFDPVKDFSPIAMTDRAPVVVVVNPAVPAKSIQELIALAKARPGALLYGSGTTGSTPHLAPELFKSMAGVDLVRVPYKAFGTAGVVDLVAGEVQVAFSNPNSVIPFIKDGKLRALAVTTAQPSALFPGLPTVAASGLPGYEFSSVTGIFAPAKTPEAIIRRLNQEIVRVLNRDQVKERFLANLLETVGSSPEQLAAFVKSDMARLGKVIKDAGIKAD